MDYCSTPCDINGTDGEAEPTVLVTVQSEEDDQIRNGGQDDSRGAQSGPAHEELARGDGVAQAGDLAEGQGHGDAGQGVAEASDLDQTRAAQDEDEGEGEVDEDVVGEERYRDDQGQADAALAVHAGERCDGVDEGEDGQDAEAEEDDGDAQDIDRVAESGQFGGYELVGSLYQEEVEEDLSANVENQAEIDSGTAAAFRGKVPGVDEETGGKDEGDGAGVYS